MPDPVLTPIEPPTPAEIIAAVLAYDEIVDNKPATLERRVHAMRVALVAARVAKRRNP